MTAPEEPTVREHIVGLLPRMRLARARHTPVWPADVFAICLSLLQHAGAYCSVLTNWPPGGDAAPEDWAGGIQELGYEWRRSWVEKRIVPKGIAEDWSLLVESFDEPLSSIASGSPLAQALLQLCAAADEACVDVGMPVNRDFDGDDDEDAYYDFKFAQHADALLNRRSGGSSLCEEIHPARGRVLPKQHTPQNGLTTRSLSHYIGLSTAHEVTPVWKQSAFFEDDDSLNLLLLPWPLQVSRTQFGPKTPLPSEMQNMPGEFGFFKFRHAQEASTIAAAVLDYYERAEKEFGKVGGIVLPETALSPAAFEQIRRKLMRDGKSCMLIAGVSETGENGVTHDQNTVRVHVPDGEPVVQHKHHRWKLTRSQIEQYNLGGVLNPNKSWWEHIQLHDRTLTFVSLLSTFTLSVLICEDLARPDPVADVVRVVGPNLVIALLMDGPQLRERWPARHAIALADDPGCSVLSFTSLGMSLMSKPLGAQTTDRSRVVAIWKDPSQATPREIELPPGHGALVLSISIIDTTEWSADGRSSVGGVPSLTGVYPLVDGPALDAKKRTAAKKRPRRARTAKR
jgi:predicted amidohydrolase